jgi:hypothetical protein
MSLDLAIGGEFLRLVAAPEILDHARRRFGAFEVSTHPPDTSLTPIVLEVECPRGRFEPAYERPMPVAVTRAAPGCIVMEGMARGQYWEVERRGTIEGSGLGAVDVLIRTALSIALPLSDALLLHGAALQRDTGDGVALCGDSGAGKSTAAAALGGACDELIVLRAAGGSLELSSTPYWAGRPVRCRCASVVCLERGGAPGFRRLRGASIARTLLRHVVRYVPIESADDAILNAIGGIAARAQVAVASCPEGEAYLPFLRETIGIRRQVA